MSWIKQKPGEYVCVEPEVGRKLLLDWESGYLSQDQQSAFIAHLEVCLYCNEQCEISEAIAKILRADPALVRSDSRESLHGGFIAAPAEAASRSAVSMQEGIAAPAEAGLSSAVSMEDIAACAGAAPSSGVSIYERIALLAYSYWEARGRQGGSPQEDWLRAEREVLKELLEGSKEM